MDYNVNVLWNYFYQRTHEALILWTITQTIFFVHLSEFKWILSSFKSHRTTSIVGHSLSILNSVKLICIRKLNKFQNQRNIEQSHQGFIQKIDIVYCFHSKMTLQFNVAIKKWGLTVSWMPFLCAGNHSTNSRLSFGEGWINIGWHQMVYNRIFRMLLLDTGCRNATVTTKTFICFDRPMIRRNLRFFIIEHGKFKIQLKQKQRTQYFAYIYCKGKGLKLKSNYKWWVNMIL